MKVFKPGLANATDYLKVNSTFMSITGVQAAMGNLYQGASQNAGISEISLQTSECKITKTVSIIRKSDKKVLHKCSIELKGKRLAGGRTRTVSLSFVIVPSNNKIKTERARKHDGDEDAVNYVCRIGENAFTDATIEVTVNGRHEIDSGSVDIRSNSATSWGGTGAVSVDFSGHGSLELEFPVKLANPLVTPSKTEIARAETDASFSLVYGQSMQDFYNSIGGPATDKGPTPFSSIAAFSMTIGVNTGVYDSMEGPANCWAFLGTYSGTDTDLAARFSAEKVYAQAVNAVLGVQSGKEADQLPTGFPAMTSIDFDGTCNGI